ncbi:hypothetical protein C84B14_13734 [Salinisphaera sp. C84B14]|uniref:DUF5666 domain-containing protein n=1 Tax=Salinisphaera sp. C84B14 TaxID=1304155 RepID=UPI003341453F
MTTSPNNKAHRAGRVGLALAGVLAALVAGGCGGSDDAGGSRQAGIEGTGIVSGFGSVYIDGTEFDTGATTIRFVGKDVPESRLSVGDRVAVTGTLDRDGNARAERIVYQRTLDGPIERIDTDGESGTLVALEQTVHFDGDTVFVNTPAAELAVGDLIAVSGFTQTANRVQAASIRQSETDFVPNSSTLEIEGKVDRVDGTQLTVGGQRIDFTNAALRPAGATLNTESRIEAFGTRGAARSDALIASVINVKSLNTAPAGRQMLVGATIDDFSSRSDFVAGNWRIDASDARRLDDGKTALAPGVVVSVRGVFENQRVKARTLRVEPRSNAMLKARVESTDADTLTLLGQSIGVSADTAYIDNSQTGKQALRLDTLAAGDAVRVQAYLDGATATARSIERLPAAQADEAAIAGAATNVTRTGTAATIVVAGVTAQLDDATTAYEDADGNAVDAQTFYTAVDAGARVRLTGPQNGDRISIVRRARILLDAAD